MFDRLVGEAYVLMRADGRLLKKDISDTTKKNAKAYRDSFDREMKAANKIIETRFKKAIAQATAEVDFSKFRKEYGTVAATVKNIKRDLRGLVDTNMMTAKSATTVRSSLKEWAKEARKAEKEQERLSRQLVSFGDVFEKTTITRVRQFATAISQATQSDNFAKLRKDGEAVQETVARLTNRLHESRTEMALTESDIDKVTLSLHRWADAENRVEIASRDRGEVVTLRGRTVRRETSGIVKAMDAVDEATSKVNVAFGKAFGKGSRNDFLNFAGSVVSGLISIATAVPIKLAGLVTHIGDSFAEGFSAARAAGLARFASAGRGLTAIFSKGGGVAGAVIAAVAAMAAFGIALPAVISLVSGLVGAVTALVGAITIGLIGALLPLIPVLAAAAAGFGALGGAMLQFFNDDKNKKFIDGLKKSWKSFVTELTPSFKTFFTFVGGGLKGVLDTVKPGIKTFLDVFQRALGDKTSQRQLATWGASMSRMFNDLARASALFIDGLVAFFVPILPYAEKLTGYIGDLAERFAKWASSANGKNQISEFMETAWAAGKKVYEIVKTIGSILGTVFFEGTKGAGDSFLQDILTKLQEVDDFLDTAAGKQSLADWFKHAKKIGEDVGNIALKIGEVIDYLDSPAGRENAEKLMDAFVGIAGVAVQLASVADTVGRIVGAMANPAFSSGIALLNRLIGATAGEQRENPAASTPWDPSKSGLGKSSGVGLTVTPELNTAGLPPDIAKALTGKEVRGVKTLLKEYLVKISPDDLLYEEKRKAIEAYVFRDKRIPVKGNDALWQATKGTIAAYVFDPKTVQVRVAGPSQRELAALAEHVRSNLSRIKVRVAFIPTTGGRSMSGGVPVTASGGVFNGAQTRVIAEAGREAVVPLDRALSQVDPSVRALSAIAQGLKPPPTASGGTFGGGRGPVILEKGAVQISTQATDGRVILSTFTDHLDNALVGVGG